MRGLAVLTLMTIFATAAAADDAERARFYARANAQPPSGSVISYCHGYGCHFKTRIVLSAGDISRLAGIMSSGRGSPAAERRAISRAVVWFENKAGRIAGTSSDRPKLGVYQGGDPTQLDCIDESANTTSLLLVMSRRGMLRHHEVLSPRTRGFLLDFRYPHNAAVIREKKGGERWAVDSWPRGNGGPPDILPLSEWMAAS